MSTVMQEWTEALSLMKQTVLIAAVRGPDGLHKNHVSKRLLRFMRRCFLKNAMDGRISWKPYTEGGGSFKGPSVPALSPVPGTPYWTERMRPLVDEYIAAVDEMPHHFQLHFMHAAEILGVHHPDKTVMCFWNAVYCRLVNDMHLNPESVHKFNERLSDNEEKWRAAEEVVAAQPAAEEAGMQYADPARLPTVEELAYVDNRPLPTIAELVELGHIVIREDGEL